MANPFLDKDYRVTIPDLLVVSDAPISRSGETFTFTSKPPKLCEKVPFDLELPRRDVYSTTCNWNRSDHRSLSALCVIDDLSDMGEDVPGYFRGALVLNVQLAYTADFFTIRPEIEELPGYLVRKWVEYYYLYHPYRDPIRWDLIKQE